MEKYTTAAAATTEMTTIAAMTAKQISCGVRRLSLLQKISASAAAAAAVLPLLF